MEIIENPVAETSAPLTPARYDISFHGKGGEYFGVIIVNWLLSIVTLGLYYPWAKARQLQYLYAATELNTSRFSFHGTGKEMFKGFIKAIFIFAVLLAMFFTLVVMKHPVAAFICLYGGIFAIIPLAIHRSYKYRLSRTSWRSIRFGYRGDRTELYKLFFKNIFFTIITFGIYGAWMAINIRKYLMNNVRFGNLKFNYEGDGGEYFVLNLKGYFLTIFTIGIYMFWWQASLLKYYIDNLSLNDEKGNKITMKSIATGGDFFGLIIVNLFIIIFTFGLGYAWVVTRTLKFMFSKCELTGSIELLELVQSEKSYVDATGEDLSDMLDLGIV